MNPSSEIEKRVSDAQTLSEMAASLEELLSGPYSVWLNGNLINIKQIVDRINGLKIEVFSIEHPPPHFHVYGNGINVTFSINDCSLIKGDIGGREKSLIKWWYNRSRKNLIQIWNETRLSDCPVGPINN